MDKRVLDYSPPAKLGESSWPAAVSAALGLCVWTAIGFQWIRRSGLSNIEGDVLGVKLIIFVIVASVAGFLLALVSSFREPARRSFVVAGLLLNALPWLIMLARGLL